MNGISLGVDVGVGVARGALAAAERSEGERSEPQRSVAAAKAGADLEAAARPDPEVVAKAKRRTYTAEYKQRILREAEAAAATRGCLGSARNGEVTSSVSEGSAPAGRGFSRHRYLEPARLSLSMVASLQSPLLFHLAKSL